VAAGEITDFRQALDKELLDSQGRRCGRVDKLEWKDGTGAGTKPTAILAGPGAWIPRLPKRLRRPARWLFGNDVTRIPWSHVKKAEHTIHLDVPAGELELGEADRGVAKRLIEKLPGSQR
jgi:hypothetical protein